MSSRGREAAFPCPASEFTGNGTCPDGNDAIRSQIGMTMREWYAGMALQGLLAAGGVTMGQGDEDYQTPAGRAAFAYADAMIAESAKPCGTDPVQVEKSLAVSAAIIALRTAANELGGTGYFAQAADGLSKAFGRST